MKVVHVFAHCLLTPAKGGEGLIVILDPGAALPAQVEPALLLTFHDAVIGEDGFVLADQNDLTAIQEYLSGCQRPDVTVSCEFGLSRSPAVAAFLLHLWHPVWSVRNCVPGSVPNEHVLDLIDQRTGRDLVQAFQRV